jgi:hypothetical protein
MECYVVDVSDSSGNLLIHREFSTLSDCNIYADILTVVISCAESSKAKDLNPNDPSVLRFREVKSKYFIIEKVCKR